MSIEIVLIPLALTAVGAWKARAESGSGTSVVRTRLRDRGVLDEALTNLGADVQHDGRTTTARFSECVLTFAAQDDGTVLAHVSHNDIAVAERLVHDVDAEYAAVVQGRLYDRLVQRAPALGLRVEDEVVDDDNAITLVLVAEDRA